MTMNKELLKNGLCQWVKINLFWLVCMLLIRMFFYFQVHTRIEIDASQFAGIMKGFVFDFYLMCHLMTWLTIPFLVLYRFFPKTTNGIFMGLVFFYVVVAALLTEYYCNLTMPLDHVVLVYTPEEVMGTASSSAHVTATPFLWFFGTMALVVLLSLLWRKVKTGFVFSAVVMLAAIVVLCCVRYKNVIRGEKYYKDHASFCLAVNQPSYSYIMMTDHLREARKSLLDDGEMDAKVVMASQRLHSLHPEFEYIDPNYPFYRKANDPDVLGGFLEKTDDGLPPNFVFIIIESYGQQLTGVNAPTVSFTPYLDSLKQQGLYWTNCLSTAQRTFGVLPSVFASAPYGKYGFCPPLKPMPNHRSLLRDLQDNGYGTSYYYGGVHDFDRYDSFLKANKVDFIYVPEIQIIDSTNYEKLNEMHRWGLDDKETFAYVMERKTTQPSPRPNVDIIMTLTTHEPFYFNDVGAYEKRVEAIAKAHPDMTAREQNNIIKNPNVYACYLYMDDCVRDLMAFYQTLPEYKNTVFVITGDHRMALLNFGGPLTQFHVPLLIYSPLLTQSRQMNAVVSHLDVTPSINAYLSSNYDYHVSEDCHWMGTSLDTTVTYRNTHKQAFMLNNRDVVDYVNGDYALSNNRLYVVHEDLSCDLVEDTAKQEQLKTELSDFHSVSCYAVLCDRLKPVENTVEVIRDAEYKDQYDMVADKEFCFLFDPYEFTDNYEDIFVDISFDYQSEDTTLPFVVVNMDPYYMGINLASDEKNQNTEEASHFHHHLSIPIQEGCKGKTMRIYLHNPNKNTMRYGNIKIQISGARKS